jgi:hypothetical protein
MITKHARGAREIKSRISMTKATFKKKKKKKILFSRKFYSIEERNCTAPLEHSFLGC